MLIRTSHIFKLLATIIAIGVLHPQLSNAQDKKSNGDKNKQSKEDGWASLARHNNGFVHPFEPVCSNPNFVPKYPGREDIFITINSNKKSIAKCAKDLNAKITIWVKLKVAPNGSTRVTQIVEPNSASKEHTQCLKETINGLTFPKSKEGIEITYPFPFEPINEKQKDALEKRSEGESYK